MELLHCLLSALFPSPGSCLHRVAGAGGLLGGDRHAPLRPVQRQPGNRGSKVACKLLRTIASVFDPMQQKLASGSRLI
jgi:hypothetical protein